MVTSPLHHEECVQSNSCHLWLQKLTVWCHQKVSVCEFSRSRREGEVRGGEGSSRCRSQKQKRCGRLCEELREDPSHRKKRLAQPGPLLEKGLFQSTPQTPGEDLQRSGAHLQVEDQEVEVEEEEVDGGLYS